VSFGFTTTTMRYRGAGAGLSDGPCPIFFVS